jgi:hypothetical protein
VGVGFEMKKPKQKVGNADATRSLKRQSNKVLTLRRKALTPRTLALGEHLEENALELDATWPQKTARAAKPAAPPCQTI